MILDLVPRGVHIDENDSTRVMIEMHGETDHFGVEAYTEGHNDPQLPFGDVGKELIRGLCYYDDGYLDDSRYGEWVEAMLRKRKNRK